MKNPTATRAIKIIQTIADEHGPAHAAFWALPNTVLTLAGARPSCDGVFYSDQPVEQRTWEQQIQDCRPQLEANLTILALDIGIDTSPAGDDYVSYDLLHRDGLEYALAQTNLLTDHQKAAFQKNISSFATGMDALDRLLAKNPRLREYDANKIRDVAIGILLGYPDEAILGLLDDFDEKAPYPGNLLHAAIKHADFYMCPQPVYDYPRTLKGNPAIKRHEKLWSTILDDFYTSSFHKALAKDTAFIQKIRQLSR